MLSPHTTNKEVMKHYRLHQIGYSIILKLNGYMEFNYRVSYIGMII